MLYDSTDSNVPESVDAKLLALDDFLMDASQSDAPIPIKHQENLPNFVMHTPLVFPVTMTKNGHQKYPNGKIGRM